jgi:hypothetical protein
MAHPTVPDFLHDMAAVRAWAERGEDAHTFESELDDTAYSDAQGRFTFHAIHPRLPMNIACFGESDAAGDAEIQNVQPGTQDALIVFEHLGAGQDRLRGHVVDAESRAPLTRFDITCSEWRHGRVMPFGTERIAVDDPQGRFELTGLDPKLAYGFVVESVHYPAKTFGPFRPSADADVELMLGRHASLRIVVTDESDTAQPGATVQLMPGLKRGFGAIFTQTLTRTTGSTGMLDWLDLEPTTYSLEAVVGALRSERVRVDAAPGTATLVQLVVREPVGDGSLEVLVHRKDGTAWPGAEITAVLFVDDEATTPGLEPVLLATTDGDGRALFEHLPAGKYIVNVADGDDVVPIQRAVVPDHGQATVTLAPKS